MAIDSHYIPAYSIEDVILDKDTGAPLSGGLVYFEQDNQRGIPKAVFQITGTSPNYIFTQLPNPMTLSSIGTFEDSLSNPVIPYFYPYDADNEVELYYVRVTNSDDVAQFDREAVPYIGASGSADAANAFANELSNPQFAVVDFDISTSTYTYNFTGASLETVQIAPDWVIEVSCPGAGSVTVSQVTPVGTLNRSTNPGTILNISSAGLTHLRLRQRLYGSPNLWGSGYLSGGFTAKTYSGTDVTLKMYYSQSDGVVMDLEVLASILPADGTYITRAGSVAIPASTSVEDFPSAYVDIEIDIPLSVEVDITSIMVAGTGQISIDDIVYDQNTLARQVDQLFHYYQVPLNFKPIPSMLTGWDFPLNPAQFLGASVTVNTTAAYSWDQTICKSVVGNVAVVRNTVTSGFQATTANAAEAFYQMQYLAGREARKIIGTPLSVNINAYRTQAGGVCNVKVYLYRGSAAATFPTLPTALGTMNAVGEFTLTAANWTLIPRGNLGQASGSLSTVNTADYTTLNDVVDLDFNGWEIVDTAQIADTDKFAIIVTYSCPTTGTVVTIDSIAMVPGDIPTRPAPETSTEALKNCQYFYQMSFPVGTIPGNNRGYSGASVGVQASTGSGAIGPVVNFTTMMRAAPNLILYNPTASSNGNIYDFDTLNSWSSSTAQVPTGSVDIGSVWGFYTSGTPPSTVGHGSAVQWTADARLGVVT